MRFLPDNIKTLLFASAIICTSCSDRERGEANVNDSPEETVQGSKTDSVQTDSNQIGNEALTKIYIKAITGYIDAIYKKDKISFDTLFLGDRKFGQPDDFPDIKLPERINGTKIELISVAESHGIKKSSFKKNSPFINLMGWVDKLTAEFVFVTFYPGFDHQYDVRFNYKYNPAKKDFELTEQRIEVLIRDGHGQADHFAIYENGRYTGDKSIPKQQ